MTLRVTFPLNPIFYIFIIFPKFAKYVGISSTQLFRVPSGGSKRQCFSTYDKSISAGGPDYNGYTISAAVYCTGSAFILSVSMATLSYRNPASSGAHRDRFCSETRYKGQLVMT